MCVLKSQFTVFLTLKLTCVCAFLLDLFVVELLCVNGVHRNGTNLCTCMIKFMLNNAMWDKLFIKSETLFYNINNILCTIITLKESA